MQSYRYQPKLTPVLLGVPLLGLVSLFAIREGLTGTRAMTVNHIIHLTSDQAAVVLLLLGAALGAFVIVCGTACILAWTKQRHIRLGASAMSMPGPFFRPDVAIRYADIRHLAIRGNRRDLRLEIRHVQGVANIMASLLPHPADIKSIAKTLADRAAIRRPGQGMLERADPGKPVFGRRASA